MTPLTGGSWQGLPLLRGAPGQCPGLSPPAFFVPEKSQTFSKTRRGPANPTASQLLVSTHQSPSPPRPHRSGRQWPELFRGTVGWEPSPRSWAGHPDHSCRVQMGRGRPEPHLILAWGTHLGQEKPRLGGVERMSLCPSLAIFRFIRMARTATFWTCEPSPRALERAAPLSVLSG